MSTQNPPLGLQRVALALDSLRTPVIAWGARSALLGAVLREKPLRLSALCFGHAVVALGLVFVCPTLLLVVGPLLLGVPHVASDVRYLVLRYRSPAAWRRVVVFFCAALFGLRIVETGFLEVEAFARIEVALLTLWVLAAATPHLTTSEKYSKRKASFVAALALGLGALCFARATQFRMVFAHAHNLVGIGLWYAMYARRGGMSPRPLLAIAGAALGLVLFGGQVQVAFPEWFGMRVEAARAWLAPGVDDPFATGLVLSYAFLQSVHYAVWLIFIPQAVSPGRGSPTFAMSLKSLWRDFGPIPLLLCSAGLALVIALAISDPLQTQAVYLFVTPFHGYLEIAALAYWFSNGAPDRERLGGRDGLSIPLRP